MESFDRVEINGDKSYTRQKRTILIVDDELSLRQALAECLINEGFDVVAASDGQEALDYLHKNEHQPELIFLDLMMPNMGGKEFRQKQLADSAISHVPIALMSGGRQSAELLAEISPQALIKKPFHLDHLFSTVNKFCV